MRAETRRGDPGAIGDYGVIGDCHTAALVRISGDIDWLCLPDFDSPSLFAHLLDARVGGQFSLRPVEPGLATQAYVGRSAVLRTVFESANGSRVQLTDFMAVRTADGGGAKADRRLVRLLQGMSGSLSFTMEFRPRPNYGAEAATLKSRAGGAEATLAAHGREVRLLSSIAMEIDEQRAGARFRIDAGQRLAFMLDFSGEGATGEAVDTALSGLQHTLDFWTQWSANCAYRGHYHDIVDRSLVTLKLLTYEPSGAMVAAPTTSLPEEPGGVRNWDYRYTWIRDASLASSALFLAGHPRDASRFLQWVCDVALHCEPGALEPLYGVRGESELPERTLDHLRGYRGSRPVRIGNLAQGQFQLDTYGELLDCFDTIRRFGALDVAGIADVWPAFRAQVDAVAKRWREPDSGMWEVRSEPRHFVFSKVMACAALDRGIAAAEEENLDGDVAAWRAARDEVGEQVLEQGVDPIRNCFVQSYGSRALDAVNLLIPRFRFLPAGDPRMEATLERTQASLMANGMLYRYRRVDDGIPGGEGAFAACTFWLAELLAASGRVSQGRDMFEAMLARANHLGLFSEQIDPLSGQLLGNFPQALTHIALVNAAIALDRLRS